MEFGVLTSDLSGCLLGNATVQQEENPKNLSHGTEDGNGHFSEK